MYLWLCIKQFSSKGYPFRENVMYNEAQLGGLTDEELKNFVKVQALNEAQIKESTTKERRSS